ncbi:MAG: class I SAM-dependent methyltransferase [Oscillospiraceae bacterium]|jgi:SAM-dependent methyltransferase|nr:class I SAM-dependent methyltransferase [Oscillospiraceae bacterium]
MAGYGGFSCFYDRLTENVGYPARAAYFDELIRRWAARPAELVLDLACGTGSLSLELARLGYDVIGVDGSPDMLAEAMEKKLRQQADVLFLCQDMDGLDLYGTVDAAVCALDSLNHITDAGTVQQVFDRVSLFLAPGGVFLFDVNSLYKHREILAGQTFVYDFGDLYCVWQNACEDGETVDISLDIFAQEEGEGYRRYTESFSERAYSHEQILEFIEKSGMKLLAVYGDDTFNPPAGTSQRLIYAALQPNPR